MDRRIPTGSRRVGHNVVIEHRLAPAIADNEPLIAELVSLKVDVIVTWSTPALLLRADHVAEQHSPWKQFRYFLSQADR